MSVPEALGILKFPAGSSPSLDEIEQQWKRLIFQNHPDRGGDEYFAKRINSAWTFLQHSYTPETTRNPWRGENRWTGPFHPPRGGQPSRRDIPEWQTDERSSYNEVGGDRTNKNYALKEIYEFSKEQGDVIDVTFWAFDGQFGRGVFTAKSNEASLGFGGEVMEDWNSKGANPYDTIAVFASFGKDNRVKLIRLRGQDVSGENRWFEHSSFNLNPFNDREFVREMRKL